MLKIFLLLSVLTALRAFTLLDKNNLEFSSKPADTSPDRMLAEKTNEIKKTSNWNPKKDEDLTNVLYTEPHKTVKKQRNKLRKGRKPRPLTLLKSAEYCRRTKKCQAVPLSQFLISKPDLAQRLQNLTNIYDGKVAEDVIVFQ